MKVNFCSMYFPQKKRNWCDQTLHFGGTLYSYYSDWKLSGNSLEIVGKGTEDDLIRWGLKKKTHQHENEF